MTHKSLFRKSVENVEKRIEKKTKLICIIWVVGKIYHAQLRSRGLFGFLEENLSSRVKLAILHGQNAIHFSIPHSAMAPIYRRL
jgi:hypothetical protein